ncbi:MAG: SAM-dependent methyltransferase, partial [Hydrogenophaga sp.]|nr:SAM-dependent methyltransferase [Hydrogenophaga sp.]
MMNFRPSLIAAAVCAASMALSGPALAQTAPAQPAPTFEPSEGQAGKDVIWLPTSQVLVDRMLAMARL